MKTRAWLALVVSSLLCQAAVASSHSSGSSHTSSSSSGSHHSQSASSTAAKTVHVQGYYRKDGTYVHGYDRAAPGTASYSASVPSRPLVLPARVAAAPAAGVRSASGLPQLGLADGTTFSMQGLPSVRGGRVAFTNAQGRFVSLPMADVMWTDSGRHYRCSACTRDAEGRIVRSETARDAFRRSHPCPATGQASGACSGYVIDHVTPLACGGEDAPANMQWQTAAEGKAKDAWERKACGRSTP